MPGKVEEVLKAAVKINYGDGWFDIIKLPNDIYAIQENGHMQEVSSFLIIGSRKALLFDTGMGIGDISAVIHKLTHLETIVLNSHSHFDHIGDNWRFPAVHIYADRYAVDVLTSGFSNADIGHDAAPELFTKDVPPGFVYDAYSIKPMDREKVIRVENGHLFDLGNRQLEVLHTPGHSQDSIMLFDRDSHMLFTGDTYCEWLFAFMGPDLPKCGWSNLQDFEKSIGKAAELILELDYLIPSHGQPLADPGVLIEVAQAFKQVNNDEADFTTEPIYGRERRFYAFNGFSIWV